MDTTIYLFEKFLDIEDSHDFFETEINHIKIWQYIRFSYCSKLLEELTGIVTANKNVNLVQHEKNKPDKKEWIRKQQFLLRKKDLLVVNHPRRVKEGDFYRCFVTDTFLESLDYSYYVFEYAYKGKHFNPVKTRGLRYRDISVIKKYFHCDNESLQSDVRRFTDRINCVFEEEFCEKFSNKMKQDIVTMVNFVLEEIYYGRIYANIILSLVRPRLVITTVGYDIYNQTLIETAKRKNIPTIELEHGRIGNSHAAYNFKSKHNLETFSDYLFVYGEYEKNTPRYPISRSRVFAVGYPELERKANIYSKRNRKKSVYKVVTFISSMADGKVIAKYALELSKRVVGKGVKIVYKLHPSEYSEWRKFYPGLEEAGILVTKKNEHDIYYYIGHSDYVVGISSTVLFEAMQFKTEIIVIKELDYQKSEAVFGCGRAMLASGFEDMYDMIEHNRKADKQDTSNYFTQNAIRNMKQTVDEILQNGRKRC